MISVDNLLPAIKQENSITESEMRSEASNGRFYSYDVHKWQSMSWVEWLARKFFFFLDSVETTCLRHSWKSIEKMINFPNDIKERIEDIFLDSLYPTNPNGSSSGIISRIFCKTHVENASKHGLALNQIDIQQHPDDRSFAIFYNKELSYLVANSAYGRLDFYNSKLQKMLTNEYDSLWDLTTKKRVGGVKLDVDYPRLQSSIELFSGKDCPLAKIDKAQNREIYPLLQKKYKTLGLVFRDTVTNQLLAVSNLSSLENSNGLINWTISVIDQAALDKRQITPVLLAWATLKHSQHYDFGPPHSLPYVKAVPKVQTFK